MSFVIQRAVDRSVALTRVRASALRIGRGTNADLRSDNPALAFEHAVIEADAAGYTISDKGSITGTYVNGRPVESARLAKGDLIEIADLRIEVQVAEAGKPMFLRVAAARTTASIASAAADEAVAAAGAGIVTAPRHDYAAAFALRRPYLTKVTFGAVLLILALGLVGEATRESNQRVFMPGGLSSAHGTIRDASGTPIGERCNACHTPFRPVSDDKCQRCHGQGPHSELAATEPACFRCHAEHRGEAKLATTAEGRCVDCHADLSRHVEGSAAQLASRRFGGGRYTFADIRSVTSFGAAHPEFAIAPDTNTLRFNHKVHLRTGGVLDGTGRRTVLQCTSCHELVESKGKVDPAPIRFDAHCRDCHRLTFDARFPRAEVPHGGDPGLVYGFVVAAYAGSEDVIGKSPVELRRILAARPPTSADQRAVLNAEQVIKTKCRHCHEITQQGDRLAVKPPVIRSSWLSAAEFTHTRHRQIACGECHRGVAESAATSDVLMPARKDCVACHGPGGEEGSSTCVTCHDYHHRSRQNVPAVAVAALTAFTDADPSGSEGGGRMFQMILIALIVILLLVVLVPVGIALYQRLRPAPPPPAPRERAPIPPPQAGRAVPPIAPPSVPANDPPPLPTQMIQLPTPAAAPEPAGTEVLQWYGMLRCTGGALEGQHFIVEEGGFYIGRDATLSKVVINDSRISKRHVRIVPRNERVYAIDEGSTNGTFLGEAGGERITEVQLRRGDKLVLADNVATFVYQI